MVRNAPLALLPLIAGVIVLAIRFYAREGAMSIWSMSFVLATISHAVDFIYVFGRSGSAAALCLGWVRRVWGVDDGWRALVALR